MARGIAGNGCTYTNCTNRHYGHGLCEKHYRESYKNGGRPNLKACEFPDCDSFARSRNLCLKHYTRLLRHGDPSIVLDRQRKQPKNNNFTFHSKNNKYSPDEIEVLNELGIIK